MVALLESKVENLTLFSGLSKDMADYLAGRILDWSSRG